MGVVTGRAEAAAKDRALLTDLAPGATGGSATHVSTALTTGSVVTIAVAANADVGDAVETAIS